MASKSNRPIPTFAAEAMSRAFRSLDNSEQLAGIYDLREILDQLEAHNVSEMRQAGWSWDAIAEATHCNSRQRAHQKFSELKLI